MQEQIEALKRDIKSLRPQSTVEEAPPRKDSSYTSRIRQEYLQSGRAIVKMNKKNGSRNEADTLARLSAFTGKLVSAKESKTDEIDEREPCDLHGVPGCFSCFDRLGETADNQDDLTFLGHTLHFDKDRMGKDLEWRKNMKDNLDVIDPRERAKR